MNHECGTDPYPGDDARAAAGSSASCRRSAVFLCSSCWFRLACAASPFTPLEPDSNTYTQRTTISSVPHKEYQQRWQQYLEGVR